jgi:hypothetical protein
MPNKEAVLADIIPAKAQDFTQACVSHHGD